MSAVWTSELNRFVPAPVIDHDLAAKVTCPAEELSLFLRYGIAKERVMTLGAAVHLTPSFHP
jgi:hypothetical protein